MSEHPMYFMTCFWGDAYRAQYLDGALPSLLAPGNLGSCNSNDRYFIYTTSAEAELLRHTPAFQRLEKLVRVEVHELEEETYQENGHPLIGIRGNRAVNRCYSRLIPKSIAGRAALVNLNPDQILSDGSIANMRRLLAEGKKAIVTSNLIAHPDTLIPELKRRFVTSDGITISVSGRDLVRVVLDHLHDYTSYLIMNDGSYYGGVPCGCNWKVEGQGLIVFTTGGDPKLLVHTDASIEWPIAAGFELVGQVYERGIREYQIYWSADSDLMVFLALEHKRCTDPHFPHTPQNYDIPYNRLRAANLIRKVYSPIGDIYLRKPIRFHHSDITPEWQRIENEGLALIESTLKLCEFLDSHPILRREIELEIEKHDALRQADHGWSGIAKSIFEITNSLPLAQQAMVHRKVAWVYGIEGACRAAAEHTKFAGACDPAAEKETTRLVSGMLRATSRHSEAQQFLKELLEPASSAKRLA